MLFLISSQQYKPNRLEVTESQKDKDYHLKYGRWVIGSGLSTLHKEHMDRYEVNRRFYANKQWEYSEDLEAFFMDESGQDRNRIRVTRNYIQPMVEQYRGNAERMKFDHKLINLSPMARSRRDKALARLLAYDYTSRVAPGFRGFLNRNAFPVGDDAVTTEARFNNVYTDQYVIGVNRMLRVVAAANSFDKYKISLARDLALAGIGIMKGFGYSGDWRFTRVAPDCFGWDRSAMDQNLLDAEYFFEYDSMSPSSIFETHQELDIESRKAIETYVTNITGRSAVTGVKFDVMGKIPAYTAVWRDIVADEHAYVTDEYGQRVLARINYIEPGEEKPKYTSKDIIPLKDLTPYQKRVLKGNSSAILYVDLWRYCKFIPNEIATARYYNNTVKDIVLDYGIVPYQEPDLYRATNMLPPYKVGTWSYLDGEILSPVDVVINPQRMINRFLSVMENMINNAGGSGVVYDKDLVGTMRDDEVIGKLNRSEPLGVHGKGKGVQNVVGKYDASVGNAAVAFSQLIENYRMGIDQITGVNDAVKGDTGNPDQLVGVMQLMIQRGSLIQEPFYKAISDIFEGCYQNIATSGRRFYIDNEIDLYDIVGDDSAEVIKLSKDCRNEAMKVTLVRSMDTQSERIYVDQQLMVWLQFGMIDQDLVSKLLGRCSMEEALYELREFNKRRAEQSRMAQQQAAGLQQQQANVQEQAGRVLYGEKIREEAREDLNKQLDRSVALQKTQQ